MMRHEETFPHALAEICGDVERDRHHADAMQTIDGITAGLTGAEANKLQQALAAMQYTCIETAYQRGSLDTVTGMQQDPGCHIHITSGGNTL